MYVVNYINVYYYIPIKKRHFIILESNKVHNKKYEVNLKKKNSI